MTMSSLPSSLVAASGGGRASKGVNSARAESYWNNSGKKKKTSKQVRQLLGEESPNSSVGSTISSGAIASSMSSSSSRAAALKALGSSSTTVPTDYSTDDSSHAFEPQLFQTRNSFASTVGSLHEYPQEENDEDDEEDETASPETRKASQEALTNQITVDSKDTPATDAAVGDDDEEKDTTARRSNRTSHAATAGDDGNGAQETQSNDAENAPAQEVCGTSAAGLEKFHDNTEAPSTALRIPQRGRSPSPPARAAVGFAAAADNATGVMKRPMRRRSPPPAPVDYGYEDVSMRKICNLNDHEEEDESAASTLGEDDEDALASRVRARLAVNRSRSPSPVRSKTSQDAALQILSSSSYHAPPPPPPPPAPPVATIDYGDGRGPVPVPAPLSSSYGSSPHSPTPPSAVPLASPRSILRNKKPKRTASFLGRLLGGGSGSQHGGANPTDDSSHSHSTNNTRRLVFSRVQVVEYDKQKAPIETVQRDRWHATRSTKKKFAAPKISNRRGSIDQTVTNRRGSSSFMPKMPRRGSSRAHSMPIMQYRGPIHVEGHAQPRRVTRRGSTSAMPHMPTRRGSVDHDPLFEEPPSSSLRNNSMMMMSASMHATMPPPPPRRRGSSSIMPSMPSRRGSSTTMPAVGAPPSKPARRGSGDATPTPTPTRRGSGDVVVVEPPNKPARRTSLGGRILGSVMSATKQPPQQPRKVESSSFHGSSDQASSSSLLPDSSSASFSAESDHFVPCSTKLAVTSLPPVPSSSGLTLRSPDTAEEAVTQDDAPSTAVKSKSFSRKVKRRLSASLGPLFRPTRKPSNEEQLEVTFIEEATDGGKSEQEETKAAASSSCDSIDAASLHSADSRSVHSGGCGGGGMPPRKPSVVRRISASSIMLPKRPKRRQSRSDLAAAPTR